MIVRALDRCPFDKAPLVLRIEPPVVREYDRQALTGYPLPPLAVTLRPEAVVIRCQHCRTLLAFNTILPESEEPDA